MIVRRLYIFNMECSDTLPAKNLILNNVRKGLKLDIRPHVIAKTTPYCKVIIDEQRSDFCSPYQQWWRLHYELLTDWTLNYITINHKTILFYLPVLRHNFGQSMFMVDTIMPFAITSNRHFIIVSTMNIDCPKLWRKTRLEVHLIGRFRPWIYRATCIFC